MEHPERIPTSAYLQIRDDAKFSRPHDLLPSIVKIGMKMEDMCKNRAKDFVPPDKCDWPELEEITQNNFRVIRLLLLSELRGGTTWLGKCKRTWQCYRKMKDLVFTLQAAEHVLATVYANKSISGVIDSLRSASRAQYLGSLADMELEFEMDSTTNSTVVKLVHVLCWMTFIAMPWWGVGVLPKPDEQAVQFANLVTRSPPTELFLKPRVTMKMTQHAIDVSKHIGEIRTIDTRWLGNESSLAKIGKLYVDSLYIKPIHDCEPFKSDWFRALAEEDILGSFSDLLSSVIGELRKERDVANQIQTKLVGLMTTAAITMLNFGYHYYVA
eukprot:TRINITY_DN77794_c0_g1_i1.p1 TRINITY_DN77794_c0_g1~~TRINITY_DN77794_c0_g1_i1.p1  ORF type:complete len:346 (+),score=54.17 TRINITY_DN77794_c0_g1_i1:58-1038(+)